MTRFEPRNSGLGSDRSNNCATTTTLLPFLSIQLTMNTYFITDYRALDSNLGSLVKEATPLPAVTQPLVIKFYDSCEKK